MIKPQKHILFQNRQVRIDPKSAVLKNYNKKMKRVIPSDKSLDKKLEILKTKTHELYKQVIDDNILEVDTKYLDFYEGLKKETQVNITPDE